MRTVLFLALCFWSCAAEAKTPTVSSMAGKGGPLKFEGSVRLLPRAQPWDPRRVVYIDSQGHATETSVPIDRKVMEEILRQSNFRPSKAMILGIAYLYLQGGISRCPDGDDFVLRKDGGNFACEINTVDRDGRLWRLKVTQEGRRFRFDASNKRKAYDDLRRLGS